MNSAQPLILMVLDGWGFSDKTANNAISGAKTPIWHELWSIYPHILLSASGLDVGLPPGQMGNSEVGHMTMGSGRVIYQDLTRINLSIENGNFAKNNVLLQAIQTAIANNSTLHILGLLSPGGIHSHEDHIAALINMAEGSGLTKIALHAFLDGRDTPPKSAHTSISKFKTYLTSIMGRFYAMDRDNRVERTNAAIDLLVHGKAKYTINDPILALESAYDRGETDEFVAPTQIQPSVIKPNDVVVCINFRTDRMRQLCRALLQAVPQIQNTLITLTNYDKHLNAQVAFPPIHTDDTLSAVLAQHDLKQLHIAETEKYAHVTFFFNAGKEEAVPGEDRILIPSPSVATYDLKPEMSAFAVTDAVVAAIASKKYAVIICNLANADMVGHTGNLRATITAIETIDICLGKIWVTIKEHGGSMLITSDHGNAETMWDESSQQAHTAHTTNLVPLIYVGPKEIVFKSDKTYGLQDIAPTMLELLEIVQPNAMTGVSLISQE